MQSQKISRRATLGLALTAGASFVAQPCMSQAFGWGEATEVQKGDDDMIAETLTYDPKDVGQLIYGQTRATFRSIDRHFAQNLLNEAEKCVGWTRTTHRNDITRLLSVFNLHFMEGGKVVPFCAAGVGFAAAMAYAKSYGTSDGNISTGVLQSVLAEVEHYHYYPSPSVADLTYVAMGKRQWKSYSANFTPKPGWLIVYSFEGKGPDHVGIVTGSDTASIHTIEFNTGDKNNRNGGVVARKTRQRSPHMMGFVATDNRPPGWIG